MPAFSQPSVMLVAAPSPPEREWLARVARALRGRYQRVIEPCAGALAIPAVFLREGWKVSQLETSDVSLFTTVMGYVAAGKPLAELEVRIDDELVPTEGDPRDVAADILYRQLMLRMEKRPDVPYWREIIRDLEERSDKHRESIRAGVAKTAERFPGLNYRALDLWDHIAEVKDDPHTVISLSPPTYNAGYEKFFDTGGRLTWNEPDYAIFDPATAYDRLAEESREWRALMVCVQGTDGGPAADPLYARRQRIEWSWYGWTNRPSELDSLGLTAIPQNASGLMEPIKDARIVPDNHEFTADSTIALLRVEDKHARYYRDLWMHKIPSARGDGYFAVFVDGYLAGIGCMATATPQQASYMGYDNVEFRFGCAPASGRWRLGRLVTELALTRGVVDMCVPAWMSALASNIATAVLTRHPEAKFLRGLMKLKVRRPDKLYGNRLIYMAPINDRSPEEAYQRWFTKERQWQKSRSLATT